LDGEIDEQAQVVEKWMKKVVWFRRQGQTKEFGRRSSFFPEFLMFFDSSALTRASRRC
jgi:hypothetical protein